MPDPLKISLNSFESQNILNYLENLVRHQMKLFSLIRILKIRKNFIIFSLPSSYLLQQQKKTCGSCSFGVRFAEKGFESLGCLFVKSLTDTWTFFLWARLDTLLVFDPTGRREFRPSASLPLQRRRPLAPGKQSHTLPRGASLFLHRSSVSSVI